MPSRVTLLALACVLSCAAIVAWKVSVLGYTLDPAASEDRWSVQLVTRARGTGERARLQLAVPGPELLPRVYDQHLRATGLTLAGVRPRGRVHMATFSSGETPVTGLVSASVRFSARAWREGEAPPSLAPPGPEDTRPSPSIPSDDAAVVAKAKELTPDATGDAARARALYDFVLDEVAASGEVESRAGALPVVETLARLQGSQVSRARLFVALARALGLPARVVRAVPLVEGVDRAPLVRAEAWVDGAWVGVDPIHGGFGTPADEALVLLRGGDGGTLVRSEGLEDARLSIAVAREGLNEYALYRRRVAQGSTLADRLSLFSLSTRLQLVFRVLLLVPLGALIVSVFRNLVGTPTFGTFMPVLVALALRETRPLAGLLVLAVVLATGIAGRRMLERMRLLVVPRLGLLLTFVIFLVGVITVAAGGLGDGEGLGAALLPMVIMTMTIERLGLVLEEEGVRSALKATGGTALVGATAYAVLQSDALQRTVFAFPELNLLVVAGLLLVGRYTGYRLTELVRFRRLAVEEKAGPGRAA